VKDLAAALRAEVDGAAARFRRMDEAATTASRGSDKWVPKQIIGHLVDSAANNHQRCVRAQLADRYVGPGYDQEAWVERQRYRDRPWTELVDLWVALNRHLAAAIEAIPEGKRSVPCTVGDDQPQTLEWVMRDYLRHLKHHLEQLLG